MLKQKTLDVCTRPRRAKPIEERRAVGFRRVTVGLKRSERTRYRFLIDVHAQELEFEPIQMRDVRDEVHEIRKLEKRPSQLRCSIKHNNKATYSDPKHMLHLEILGACVAILLHDFSNRRIVEFAVISLN